MKTRAFEFPVDGYLTVELDRARWWKVHRNQELDRFRKNLGSTLYSTMDKTLFNLE